MASPPPPPPPPPSSSILEVPSLATNEVIPIDLDEIFSAPGTTEDEIIQQLNDVAGLLRDERAAVRFWVRLVEECWNRGRSRAALNYADQGLTALAAPARHHSDPPPNPVDHIPLLALKANYHLALARRAPKTRLERPRTGPLTLPKDPNHPEFGEPQGPLLKEEYWRRVGIDLDRAEGIDRSNKVVREVRAAWFMAKGKLDDANRLFDAILLEEPTHLMALMGRARILFSRLSFRPALKTYQQVLQLDPTFLPDPRIGIGLCFWMLGDRDKARRAWERSLIVNPAASPSATLLLGLLHLNRSRDPTLPGGDDARASAYEKGLGLLQAAFKRDNTLAAAMGPLGGHMLLQKDGGPAALKLAERQLQFAESRLLVAEAHLAIARALDADPDGINTAAALVEYQRAGEANPELLPALLGVGGCFVRTEQFPAAINAFETIVRKHPRCIEALVSLASIHTHLAFTFHSISDSSASRKAAKEAYEAVLRIFAAGKTEGGEADKAIAKSERIRVLAEDRDLFIEMARLWSDEVGGSVERSLRAYQEAARIEADKALDLIDDDDESQEAAQDQAERSVDPKIRNNLGVLLFQKRAYAAAQEQFERAFERIGTELAERGGGLDGGELDAALTAVGYNLAVVYEREGLEDKAREGWEGVLRTHPEYVEAKARLALLDLKKRGDRHAWGSAHELIKQALTSQPSSPELRALYTYFLVETSQHRMAREFARATLKELNRHDIYALCALGMLSYLEARENKDPSKEAQRDRTAKYVRAAEFFDKALQLDPMCASAAQGLAIGLAEGTLGTGQEGAAPALGGAAGGQGAAVPLTEQQARQRNARDALVILTKVKESINDASVYVNIGHCHFARDEFERAAENYATASKRYLNDKSSTVLWYLARAWYHKSLKEQTFGDLQKAIEIGQQATDLYPKDLSALFNMAVLKQKAIEILINKPAEARTSADLRAAYEHLEASNALFDMLANDPTPHPPYPKEVPRHRRSYGNSLINRFQAVLDQQLAYEATEAGKINAARQRREEEKQRQLELEKARLEEIQKQAEQLAEQRKRMREEAEQWAAMSKAWADSDEEDGGGKKKRGGAGGGGKRKKGTKIKGGEDDGGVTESSGAEDDKPVKKKRSVSKKEKKPKKSKAAAATEPGRAMDLDEQYDEDDEDAPIRAPGRKAKNRASKAIKSAEFIDSEEEDE
ncbi:hypothetical protein JCM1841_003285 [Sporobolomyces salmonicolor]